MESILTSIKKMIGINKDDDSFDTDIIVHINTALADLTKIGVGPSEGFSIQDAAATWTDFIPKDPLFESIKTYVYIQVKLVFDPPQNSTHLKALEDRAKKLEWDLNITAETR